MFKSSYHRLATSLGLSSTAKSVKEIAKEIFNKYVAGEGKARGKLGPFITEASELYGVSTEAISYELGLLQNRHDKELEDKKDKKELFESSRRLVEQHKEKEVQDKLDHEEWIDDIREYEDDAEDVIDTAYYGEYTSDPDEDE